jgi:DNA-binding MarR family transcriptional regulator
MDRDDWPDIDEVKLLPVWEPIRPAQAHLNHWVRTTDRNFARNFGRLLKKTGIIASEWAACRVLYHPGGMSPLAVAAAIGMTPGGGSKLVTRLVKKGLAIKDSNSFDRRFRSVRLTRKGRELVAFMASLEKQADREFSIPLGNNRRFRLTDYMKQLHGARRSQHMHEWISLQLKNPEFQRFTPVKKISSISKPQEEFDELYDWCQRASKAMENGEPRPPWPWPFDDSLDESNENEQQ